MKITIITVCYNARDVIENTIKSVIKQSYQNIEYIIIDGGSIDGTKEIIEKYKNIFPIIFISEKDDGIYDAMNKGIKLSSGEWLNFMNAGDVFLNTESISEVLPWLKSDFDIVYGSTEIRYKDFKTIKKGPNPNKLWLGYVPHQSAFIKSLIMKKYLYNENNKIAGDLEFFLNVYYNGGKIKKINQIISSFAKDGITEQKGKQVIEDAYKTVRAIAPSFKVDFYYSLLKIKPLLKKILPRKIFKFIKTKIKF